MNAPSKNAFWRDPPDTPAIAAAAFLTLWGILTILSSQSEAAEPFYLAGRQMLFGIAALAVLTGGPHLPFAWFRRAAKPLALVSFAALVLVLLCGEMIHGMRGWFRCGDYLVQPSEVAKFAAVLALAQAATRPGGDWRRFGFMLGTVLLWIFPILMQPDFGTASLYAATAVAIFFLAGGGLGKIALFAGVGAGAAGVFLYTHAYAWKRLIALYAPENDPLGGAWHLRQLELAIARGGWFGAKMGGAVWSNAYVPLAYNDSVCATLLETLGFAGFVPVVAAYAVILLVIWRRSLAPGVAADARLTAQGCVFFILVQALLHLGVNLTLLPPTGVTLPWISYGGSSLIGSSLLLALAACAVRERSGKTALPEEEGEGEEKK